MIQKFVAYIHWINEAGEVTHPGPAEEYRDIGMIQMIERLTHLKHTDGTLREIHADYWEFDYVPRIIRQSNHRNRLIIQRETDNEPPQKGVKQLSRPRFK